MYLIDFSASTFSCLFFKSVEVVLPQLTVHWQESYYSVIEADGSVEVCAKLSTLQFEGSVQFDYTTFGDSAEGM